MNLQSVQYKILYNTKNITKDVSDYLLSLSYSDKSAGESDEIELELHDRDLLWQNDWYPSKGSKISVQIIDGNNLLDCGSFTIDENEFRMDRSSSDLFAIRGMAAAITKALRTPNSSAHENKTLKELCNTIAAKHSLTVVGTIADISISRITQYRESDLAFLHRIAKKYGYVFSIRDGQMVFTSLVQLQTKAHVVSIDKTDCSSFTFKTTSKEVVKEVNVKYHNPQQNKTIIVNDKRGSHKIAVGYNAPVLDHQGILDKIASFDTSGGDGEEESAISDDANVYEPVDNDQQAEAIAKTVMQKSISQENECSVTCRGNVLLVCGNQVELTGFGRFSGIYYILESGHTLSRSGGYVTSFTANKTGIVATSKHRPKKKKDTSVDDIEVDSSELE